MPWGGATGLLLWDGVGRKGACRGSSREVATPSISHFGRRRGTMSSGDAPADDTANWRDKALADKKKEYEVKKARAKAFKLRLTCTICGEKAKLNCPCGTTQCAPARVGGGARS